MTVYSNNLRIPHLDQNVASPEIPENTAKDIIDSVMTNIYTIETVDEFDITITHTDSTTTTDDWQSFVFDVKDTGTFLTGSINVILPDNTRPYIFRNSTAYSITFKTATGGFSLVGGGNAYAYCNGTTIERLEFSSGGEFAGLSDTPNDYVTDTGAGWAPVINGAQDGLEWFDLTTLPSTFKDLDDTPTDYTTDTGVGWAPVINAAQDGLEWFNLADIDISTKLDRVGDTIKDYGETSSDLGNISGAVDLDISLGNVITATTAGTITFTFTTTHTNTSFTLVLEDGGVNITWPAVVWGRGVEPTLKEVGLDYISFAKVGSTWFGTHLVTDEVDNRTTFISLNDTPSAYSDTKLLQSTSTGIQWYDNSVKLDVESSSANNITLLNATTNSGTISGGNIEDVIIKDYGEVSSILGTSGNIDIDLSTGSIFTCAVSGNIVFTFTTDKTNTSFTLLIDDGYTKITWPVAVVWKGGIEPDLSIVGSDFITFSKIGSIWIGAALIGVS